MSVNRFARAASKYAYYGYLTKYEPATLRKYQSERHYDLGRRGAYDTIVLKMGTDHVNYEEDMNLTYKTPVILVNTYQRVGIFLFFMAGFFLVFCMDDMLRMFVPFKKGYIGIAQDARIPSRYESLYIIQKLPPKYV